MLRARRAGCTDYSRAGWHGDPFWSGSEHTQAALAWFVPSPGRFDALGSPRKPRLSAIPRPPHATPCSHPAPAPSEQENAAPCSPPARIKETRRDLQILPSSRFRFRAFKNKAERKWRAWGFLLPRRVVSVSGFTSGLEVMSEQPKTCWWFGVILCWSSVLVKHIPRVTSSSTSIKPQLMPLLKAVGNLGNQKPVF